jgi:hypothetical protein
MNEMVQLSCAHLGQLQKILKTVKFSRAFYFSDFHECRTVKRELKMCENFNSNALTIKFLQQTWNFVYR